ncbi:MAG: DUF4080 domain-containing protein, partial [Verrucomicrobia bacterium]|nr:DUF4080 domain-containing protein [Verrucomicrobiota bacterium]
TYVESSRGCPYHCDYCLSAGDAPVRYFPLSALQKALDRLLVRGARSFKFVDRTFNLEIGRCLILLTFFLERMRPGLFVHFEMVPDRFPPELREVLARFPAGALQLEIGIQTFNPEVAARIHRPLNLRTVEDNLTFLRQRTAVRLHTDLIAGLPGETLESFAAGFDRLVRLDPHKIQVGILKRLRGSAIARHDGAWKMRYSARPPYEVLSTSVLDEDTLQGLQRFARYWELVVNRGRFPETAPLLWRGRASPFAAFHAFSEWLHLRFGRAHALPLSDLALALAEYPALRASVPAAVLRESLRRDYIGPGRPNLPGALNEQA